MPKVRPRLDEWHHPAIRSSRAARRVELVVENQADRKEAQSAEQLK
jgi:hypothetical protein